MARRKLTKKASAFIARKFRTLRKEGYPPRQAAAIAYAKARKARFKVPRRRRR